MSNYKIGTSYTNLTSADTFFGSATLGKPPRSTYSPGGERVMTLSGNMRYLGYTRVTWSLAPMTIPKWAQVEAMLATFTYSGELWIQTRDDKDNWFIARVILNLPDPKTLERSGHKYVTPVFEFIVLERWDLVTFTFSQVGTSASAVYYIQLPYAWKLYGVMTCSTASSKTSTLAIEGAIAGTIKTATQIGVNATPIYIQPTTYPVDIQPYELVTLTYTANTAATNPSLVVVASASL